METEASNMQLVKAEVPIGALIVATQDRLGSIKTVGEWVARSGMYGTDKLEQGNMIAVQCIEEGLKLSEWPRIYNLIQGRPSKRAIAAQAEFEDKGGVVEWLDIGSDGKKATARFTWPGKKQIEVTFTIEQAERAQLVKKDSNWQKWPDRMLRARVLSEGISLLAPKIYAGTYDDSDAPPAPQMNLAPEPTAEPKPAKVVTVETVVEPREKPPIKNFGDVAKALAEDREAKAAIKQPSAPPAPRPNPSATTSVPGTHTHTPMSTETATQLATVLRTPDEIMKAVAFFIGQKWLAEGQTIEDLSDAAAKKVIGNAESFRKKVLGAA